MNLIYKAIILFCLSSSEMYDGILILMTFEPRKGWTRERAVALTRTLTNTDPNDTEANAAAEVYARATWSSQNCK